MFFAILSFPDWCHFPYDGSFTARIVKTEKAVFSKTKETVIWEEDLQFGNPYAFRFASKFLYPTEARCWDWRKNRYQTIHLNSDYLCIYQMEYVGHSKPFDDEDEELPEYTACCSFFDPRCQEWRPYNSNEFSDAYEWINPVRVCWDISSEALSRNDNSPTGRIRYIGLRMQQIKRFLKEVCIYSVIGVVLAFGFLHYFAYLEKKDCLCSMLTVEEKTYPIDERLSRVIDPNTVNSGTFAIFTTFCDHRVRMRLIVTPDVGT